MIAATIGAVLGLLFGFVLGMIVGRAVSTLPGWLDGLLHRRRAAAAPPPQHFNCRSVLPEMRVEAPMPPVKATIRTPPDERTRHEEGSLRPQPFQSGGLVGPLLHGYQPSSSAAPKEPPQGGTGLRRPTCTCIPPGPRPPFPPNSGLSAKAKREEEQWEQQMAEFNERMEVCSRARLRCPEHGPGGRADCLLCQHGIEHPAHWPEPTAGEDSAPPAHRCGFCDRGLKHVTP